MSLDDVDEIDDIEDLLEGIEFDGDFSTLPLEVRYMTLSLIADLFGLDDVSGWLMTQAVFAGGVDITDMGQIDSIITGEQEDDSDE